MAKIKAMGIKAENLCVVFISKRGETKIHNFLWPIVLKKINKMLIINYCIRLIKFIHILLKIIH